MNTEKVGSDKVRKRNHYVPQFYLKYFADPANEGVVWVYDKENGEVRPQNPINTGVEKHLYTIKNETGEMDDSLEKWFAGLEGATKPILDRWIQSKEAVSEEEKPLVAKFIAFLNTRVPRSIEIANEIGVAMALEHVNELATDPERFKRLYSDYVRDTGDTDIPPVEVMLKGFQEFEDRFRISVNLNLLWELASM